MPHALQLHLGMMCKYSKFGVDTIYTFRVMHNAENDINNDDDDDIMMKIQCSSIVGLLHLSGRYNDHYSLTFSLIQMS